VTNIAVSADNDSSGMSDECEGDDEIKKFSESKAVSSENEAVLLYNVRMGKETKNDNKPTYFGCVGSLDNLETTSDKKILFSVHGFNEKPKKHLNFSGRYHEKQLCDTANDSTDTCRDYFIVPVIWNTSGNGLKDYLKDKNKGAPIAARNFADLSMLLKNGNSPKSIMVHSMGNYILKMFAEDIAEEEIETPYFDDIFMVAPDVRVGIFDEGSTDGVNIAKLASAKVHVLWAKRDYALFGRRFFNNREKAIGANGRIAERKLNPSLKNKVIFHKIRRPCADGAGPICHNYHFADEAIGIYSKYSGN